jgi:DNA-binding NtrC family response regulator
VAIELPAVRILIVDDDRAICDYMQTLLERDGYEVKTLADPLVVEEEVRTGGYHLIILDLMMPKLDGIEVLKRIRKVDNDIAVVIFTGFPNLESAVASMKLDAVDYIKKPFNVDEFREVLTRVMKKKGLARTPEEQLHKIIGDTIRAFDLRQKRDAEAGAAAHLLQRQLLLIKFIDEHRGQGTKGHIWLTLYGRAFARKIAQARILEILNSNQ